MTATDPAIAALIREVLAEELAHLRAVVREERVRIASDADLTEFARRVLAMADDRAAREAFENGRLVFRLDANAGRRVSGAASHVAGSGRVRSAGGSRQVHRDGERGTAAASTPPAAPAPGVAGDTQTIDHGLLSERGVERLPRGTARIQLGRRVRLTPLARDRLRRRGIAIEWGD